MKPKDALEISRAIGESVRREVLRLAGKRESDVTVGIGKDGTPTKKIDKVAEDIALDFLKDYDLTVISEEAGVVGEGGTVVALDPVDGTFNAVKGVPFYSISLCFSRSRFFEDSFFAYVMNLATGTEYYSINGKSFRDGDRIRVSGKSRIEDANVIFYYPERSMKIKRIRIFGCASLEICLVADGTFDAFIDVRGKRGFLRIFDVAAGLFIAENAGAVVTDEIGKGLGKKEFSMRERFKIVVSNKKLHKKMLELIK